jgi:hypothetical protein
MSAPVDVVASSALTDMAPPVEVTTDSIKTAILRNATNEPEVMPVPAEFGTSPWDRSGN